ncbi:MAG: SPOR domain-containing protein [Brumimicrobium sp.]
MDKYIKQLLETYSKVILPSFGAIVVENEETGNLMFNEYLNYNDGKLDKLIVDESNMELQEAQNTIAKYVREIQLQLDKGESYDLFKLGRFFKNSKGEIEFDGNLKTGGTTGKSNTKKETPKKTEKDTKKPTQTTDSKPSKKEETKPEKETKKPTPKETKKEDSKKAVTPTKKENKYVENKGKEDSKKEKEVAKSDQQAKDSKAKEDKKAAELKQKEEKKAADLKKKEEKKSAALKQKEEKKAAAAKKKAEKSKKKPEGGEGKKKKLSVFFWIAIIILCLFAAGGVYVGLNYDKVKSYMNWDEFDEVPAKGNDNASDEDKDASKEAEEEELSSTGAEKDTTDVEASNEENDDSEENDKAEGKPKEKEKPAPSQTGSKGSHHLIGGSFSELSNAEKLVKEMQSKGYDSHIVGQFGGLHFVSVKSYNSSKAAREDINNVRQDAPGAWIFQYSK